MPKGPAGEKPAGPAAFCGHSRGRKGGRCSMLALLLAPVYLVLNAYLARWLLRWMAACTHWFKKKWAVGCIMAFYIFVSLSPLTGFLITQGPVHRFLKLLGNYWLGTLAYILLTVLVLDAVRLIWKRTRWGAKGLRHPRRAFVAAGGFVILFVAGISAWGILHAQNVVLREETVTVHKACTAARQGELRIALVSDLHLGYNVGAAQVRRVVETVNETQPDVVVLAGDVFDNEYAAVYQPEKIAALLRGIRSRFGVYACWGNHDVSEQLLAGFSFTAENPAAEDEAYRAFFQNAGVQLLEDESVLVENAFYLVGRQDPQRQEKLGQSRLSPAQLLAGLDAEKPVFVIDHQPRQLEELAAAGADLALSGHTHNGQMFPGNLLIRLAWKNPAGVLQVGNMTSCVTQGAGVWGPAMRVGTDSEVMLLHVRFAP